jgi:hypothetical protein
LLPITEDGGSIEDKGLPSDMPAFELGPPHAGAHSLDDLTALQLSDGADDVELDPCGASPDRECGRAIAGELY